jgi:hypothetical protein
LVSCQERDGAIIQSTVPKRKIWLLRYYVR